MSEVRSLELNASAGASAEQPLAREEPSIGDTKVGEPMESPFEPIPTIQSNVFSVHTNALSVGSLTSTDSKLERKYDLFGVKVHYSHRDLNRLRNSLRNIYVDDISESEFVSSLHETPRVDLQTPKIIAPSPEMEDMISPEYSSIIEKYRSTIGSL